MMRIFILSLLTLLCTKMYAQDGIVDRIVHVRHLISDSSVFNPSEAFSELQLIEKDCTASDNDTLKAVYWGLKGQTLFFLERYKDCIAPCKEAIQLFEQCNVRQCDYLDAFRIIGISYHRIKDFENAERFYRKGLLRSVGASVNTSNQFDQYRAGLYLNLGNLYKAQGDSILAAECYNRLTHLEDEKPVDIDEWNYIDWENSCWDKIGALTKSEKYQDAVDVYSEMIPAIKDKRGENKTYILAVYSKAILLSRYLNKIEEALPLFEEVVELGNNTTIVDESVCGAYDNLGLCYAYKGEFGRLDSFIQKALDYLSKAQNEYYPPHSIYRYVGNGAYWTGNYKMAILYYEMYLSPINKREKGSNFEEITNMLSVSYILAGKPQKAKQLLTNFLNSEEKRLKNENLPALANIYHNIGRAYMLENSISEALKYLNNSKELQIRLWGNASERTQLYIKECMSK